MPNSFFLAKNFGWIVGASMMSLEDEESNVKFLYLSKRNSYI